MFGSLKFDKMVDTKKAEEYMKSCPAFERFDFSVKNQADRVNSVKHMFAFSQRSDDSVQSLAVLQDISIKFKTLVNLVEENKLLFAQIDYLLRKKPIDESLNIDLKLIIQNIKYMRTNMKIKTYTSNVLEMGDRSPLAALGFVAQLCCAVSFVEVKAAPDVAVLCHLFVQLCRQAELMVVFVPEQSADTASDQTKALEREVQRGCVCAVTERSDVEAAVDTVVASASQDPWRVRRVLVQESVLESFERVLDWKSKRNPSVDGMTTEECSRAYRIDDKLFLLEYAGLEQVDGQVVVEAYRTVKELLSLLDAYKPFAVSLWCADVSQANEVAYGIESPVVWINDYGSFYGPLKSSQAFYSVYDISYATKRLRCSFDVKSLIDRRNNWIKLDATLRYELLNRAMEKAGKSEDSDLLSLQNLKSLEGHFAEVTDNGICVGLERQCPVVLFCNSEIKPIATCLLQGFAVVLSTLCPAFDPEWLKVVVGHMEEAGVPLVKSIDETGECEVTSPYSNYRVKVVRTNFGTIFAN